jgi:hypothetical protein
MTGCRHIHRKYKVFQSSRRQIAVALRTNCLQHPDPQSIDAMIIRRYKMMYDVFFEEQDLIPEGRYYEVSYEELERDRIGQVRQIYEKLNLPSFDAVQQPLQRYIDSFTVGKPAPGLLYRFAKSLILGKRCLGILGPFGMTKYLSGYHLSAVRGYTRNVKTLQLKRQEGSSS